MKEKKEKKPKVELSPEQKKARRKKRGKIAGITIGVIVVVLGLLIGIFAIVNVTGVKGLIEFAGSYSEVEYDGDKLVPVLDENDGYWTFTLEDGDDELKILQFTDVHIGAGFGSLKKDRWALNAVANMVRAEQPDLVVVTGDIAYPVPFQAGTFNNLNATEIFATLMESLGVYWTFTFGNHDTEAYSSYDRQDICNWYEDKIESEAFKYCLFQSNPKNENSIDGYGNQIIKVVNEDGIVTQALTMFDSHSYINKDPLGVMWKYDNIKDTQIDWYENEMKRLSAENKALIDSDKISADKKESYTKLYGEVKSLAFFHIALREFRDAWSEYRNNGNNYTDNVTFVNGNVEEDESKKNSDGEQTWGIWCGVGKDDLYDTGARVGLQGVFIGHDHYNNFTLTYKKEVEGASQSYLDNGIYLSYGMSIDYLAYPGIYKEGAQRGCTVITLDRDGILKDDSIVKKNYYKDYSGFDYRGEKDKEDI